MLPAFLPPTGPLPGLHAHSHSSVSPSSRRPAPLSRPRAFPRPAVMYTKPDADPSAPTPPPPAPPPAPLPLPKVRKKTFPELVVDRVGETINDAALLLRRKYFPVKADPDVVRPRVVVLGAGWAAHAMTKVLDTEKYEVAVVSPRNYFLFTPMLASSAVGTVEFRSVSEPIRKANETIIYYEAKCIAVDRERSLIKCETVPTAENPEVTSFDLPYSYLAIGVGAITNTFGTPGVAENCYFLKEIEDARRLRIGIVNRFERANIPDISEAERDRLLHFVVIGGGPTGCEFAAELNDFVANDLTKYYPKLVGRVRTTLLQSGANILLQFDAVLQQSAMDNFKSSGIDVVTGARVTSVTPKTISLKDGRTIDYGLALWAAGNGVNPLVQSLLDSIPEQANARSRLLVDDWLRVLGTTSIFALGDCAEAAADPLPATAQVAGQQGAYLARLLNKDYCVSCELPERTKAAPIIDITGQSAIAKPFQFMSLGILAYIGNSKALAQVEAGEAQFNLAGTLTFALWRSVYLTKQVSLRNRVLVLFDWFKTRAFGRDISQF